MVSPIESKLRQGQALFTSSDDSCGQNDHSFDSCKHGNELYLCMRHKFTSRSSTRLEDRIICRSIHHPWCLYSLYCCEVNIDYSTSGLLPQTLFLAFLPPLLRITDNHHNHHSHQPISQSFMLHAKSYVFVIVDCNICHGTTQCTSLPM